MLKCNILECRNNQLFKDFLVRLFMITMVEIVGYLRGNIDDTLDLFFNLVSTFIVVVADKTGEILHLLNQVAFLCIHEYFFIACQFMSSVFVLCVKKEEMRKCTIEQQCHERKQNNQRSDSCTTTLHVSASLLSI